MFQAIIPRLDSFPLPTIMTSQLLAAIGKKSSAAEIKKIIEVDPAVTIQVLKVSNSAYYGQRSNIQNIERAILLMGVEEIRNICLSICLIARFNTLHGYAKNFHTDFFWRHSLLTAMMSAKIAAGKEWIKEEDAFILGLLHDIGKAVSAASIPSVFDAITDNAGTLTGSRLYAVEQKKGITHTLIGSWIATRWNLPPVIRAAIEFHHDTQKAVEEFLRPVALINISNAAADSVLTDPLAGEKNEEFPDETALNVLNLLPEEYPEIIKEARHTTADADSIFSVMQS